MSTRVTNKKRPNPNLIWPLIISLSVIMLTAVVILGTYDIRSRATPSGAYNNDMYCTIGTSRPANISYYSSYTPLPNNPGNETTDHEVIAYHQVCTSEKCYGSTRSSYWEPENCKTTTTRTFPKGTSYSDIIKYFDGVNQPSPTSCISHSDECSKGDISCGPHIPGADDNYRSYTMCISTQKCGRTVWEWGPEYKGRIDEAKCNK